MTSSNDIFSRLHSASTHRSCLDTPASPRYHHHHSGASSSYRRRSPSPSPSLLPSHDSSQHYDEHICNNSDCSITDVRFKDIFMTNGRYPTLNDVRSSPFYTQTETRIESGAHSQDKFDMFTRVVHATHPISRAQLIDLGVHGLRELGEGLEEERWEASRNTEFRERVNETLERVDDLLEHVFGVEGEGTRFYSGREPGRAVVMGNEERMGN